MRLAPAFLATCVALAACGGADEPAGGDPGRSARARPVVFAVNLPLAAFAERIGGDRFDVRFPAPPGVDPADWMPPEDVLAEAQSADLILANGARYAGWLSSASLPPSRLVVTAESFSDRWIESEGEVVHRHGPEGAHSHRALASTTWLDLTLAAEQARAVAAALAEREPALAAELETALEELVAELERIDARWRAAVAADPDRPLLASHPVYAYLARRLGLNLRSVHWEPDEMPAEAEWAALAELRTRHAARVMLWEAEPLPATAERLASLGVASVVLDPAGGRRRTGRAAEDFLDRLHANSAALERAFAPPGREATAGERR